MLPLPHRIRRLTVQVGASSARQAFALRQKLRADLEATLLGAVTRVFDEFAFDEVLHIPKLTLELRISGAGDVALDVADAAAGELRVRLRRAAVAAGLAGASDPSPRSPDRAPSEAAAEPSPAELADSNSGEALGTRGDWVGLLLHYLETGALPWPLAHARPADALAVLKEAATRAEPRELMACLQPGAAALPQRRAFWFRWLQLVPEAQGQSLIEAVFPPSSAPGSPRIEWLPVAPGPAPAPPRQVRLELVAQACAAWGVGELTGVGPPLREARERGPGPIERSTAADVSTPAGSAPDLAAHAGSELAPSVSLGSARAEAARGTNPEREAGARSLERERAASAASVARERTEPPASGVARPSPARAGATPPDALLRARLGIQPAPELARGPAATGSAEWPHAVAGGAAIAASPATGLSRSGGVLPLADASAPEVARGVGARLAPFGRVIQHAGLVLLHPFLSRLFEGTSIKPAGKPALLPEALPRAAALLHRLASGADEIFEFELDFIKLLLGLPIEAPLGVSEGLLAPSDRAEADALLSAVIGHWSALKSTSVQGLQSSFLARPGLLREDDRGFRLAVEVSAYDVLLRHLPWGFGTFRLPWMKKAVFTDWPASR